MNYYEGHDNHGDFHRIEKRIDPKTDGTRLAADYPVLFDINNLPKKMSVESFDQLIKHSIPQNILDQIEKVIATANSLAEQGQADPVAPENQDKWKRGMYLSWVHSRDMETIMAGLGYPKVLKSLHDLGETCKAKYLKKRISSADQWYIDYLMEHDDDDDVIIGFFNPNLSGSLYNWGLRKMGVQNAMDAHRLSDHHIGNPDNPLDFIEKAVNFVNHHIPREHYGIRHEPRGDWENIEEIMIVDHSTRNNPLLRLISRDAAIMFQLLEKEGKIVPWQLLDPSLIHPMPNSKLKLEKSKVLRDTSLHGSLIYDPEIDLWEVSGGSGWVIKESTDGDPLSVRIAFNEAIEVGYSVNLTPRSYGNSRIVSCELIFSDENGFRVLLDTDFDYLTSRIGFDFTLVGLKKAVVPDDRTIPKHDLIEDLHAIENILSHEAEFGMITVMSSASVKSADTLNKEKARRQDELKKWEDLLSNTRLNDEINQYKREIERVKSRIGRIDRMIVSSKYYDSAVRFGELWGEYSRNGQKEDLGGRHIPICTGGGPGIMEAIAKGASSKHAQVIGVDSIFGNDNRFDLEDDFSIYSNVRLRCNDFAIREAALINYSHVILFWPGGYGTTWEIFETLAKIQTDHLRRYKTKAIFVHSEFWMPLYEYVKHLIKAGTINDFSDRIKIPGVDDQLPDDRYVAKFVADENEAFEVVKKHVQEMYNRNNLSLS